MTRWQRRALATLDRRARRLEARLADPGYHGDRGFQAAEAAAILWAIRLIVSADDQGVLDDLSNGAATTRGGKESR